MASKQPIHPNDDVNRGPSSNDTFPAVMHIAAVEMLDAELLPAIGALRDTLDAKAHAFEGIVMIGRTHLMDATPVTRSGDFWMGRALDEARATIEFARNGLYPLALGGTAVGTGLNAHARFGDEVAAAIAREMGKPFVSAANKFAALSAHDAMVNVSAAVRTLGIAAMKIANDVRWHASGPRAGLGSSDSRQRAGFVDRASRETNASEALTMVVTRVFGNDATVAFAGSQGNFQLNVYKPVMLHATLESIELLADALASFDLRCARGIEPIRENIRENVERSLMLVTALNPHIGYENAAKIALHAHREKLSLREAALRLGLVGAEDFDRWVDAKAMTRPGNG